MALTLLEWRRWLKRLTEALYSMAAKRGFRMPRSRAFHSQLMTLFSKACVIEIFLLFGLGANGTTVYEASFSTKS